MGFGQIMLKQREDSASFLKKRSKKLFCSWALLVSAPQSPVSKSFCAAFFKGRPLPYFDLTLSGVLQ
jgi:hypothetical protein